MPAPIHRRPVSYAAICAGLRAPRRIVVDVLESLAPAAKLPDDPEWPTPADEAEARELLNRLPHRQRVACAIAAAELALPLWESWAPIDAERPVPRQAVETVRRWLHGRASVVECVVAAARPRDVVTAQLEESRDFVDGDGYAHDTALLAADLCEFAADENNEWSFPSEDAIPNFYARWWARCRAVLAFAHVSRAHLE